MNATSAGRPGNVPNAICDTTTETTMTETPTTPAWRDGTTAVHRLTDWIANRPVGDETADADALDRLASDVAEVLAVIQQFGNVETEWTVARHWRHSIEYGAHAMSEEYARNEVREELECGAQASVAYRLAGQWRHEDPEAQRHADVLADALKAAGR